ncbi:MAG TPA: hypothetical protein VNB67_02315 [Nitrososphaeraceae archaeon]|nr:hypothetical protein [Nitrososphaeraceae archaeon]
MLNADLQQAIISFNYVFKISWPPQASESGECLHGTVLTWDILHEGFGESNILHEGFGETNNNLRTMFRRRGSGKNIRKNSEHYFTN